MSLDAKHVINSKKNTRTPHHPGNFGTQQAFSCNAPGQWQWSHAKSDSVPTAIRDVLEALFMVVCLS